MRARAGRWLTLFLVLAGMAALHLASLSEAVAQSGAQSAAAEQTRAASPARCVAKPGMIGLARTVEIDTTRGPRFGSLQYPEFDFLQDREVVLTFDDGPMRKHTRMVLDALAAHCTKATFFMVGQMALADPETAREVAAAGHTIGSHTWSHRNLRAVGGSVSQHEIELGISAIQRALGARIAPFFRFPYLADSSAATTHLIARNQAIFSIDADSKDYKTSDPRQMQRTLLGNLEARRKGILLFHDIKMSTANGIGGLLEELNRRGYRVVHMVPKDPSATVASFDALANAELARRNKMAASNPLYNRSVVAPLTPPSAGVEPVRLDASGQRNAGRGPNRAAAAAVTPAQGTPASQPSVPAAVTMPAAQPASAPEERPQMRGSTDDDDWRRKVFQN